MSESYIVSGQNVRIKQHLAGLAPRMIAFVIDCNVIWWYFYCFIQLEDALLLSQIISEWGFFLIAICPCIFYWPLCEALTNGQSVGKYLCRIRVIRLDGQPLTLGNSLLRFLLLTIDALLGCGLGAILIAVTPKSQRLGDMAAGTTVVGDRAFRASRVDLSEYDYLLGNYVPTYPRSIELTQKQADIIAHVLAAKGKNKHERLLKMARKVEPICGRTAATEPNEEAYLTRVLCDWRYYQLREV